MEKRVEVNGYLPPYLDVLKINAMFGILERDERGGD